MTGPGKARRLLIPWLLLLAISWAHTARATPAEGREAFKKGVEAIDLGRFDEAISQLRLAVRADGRESDERIFLSGVFSRPYLPHFFLGWALYRAGLDHCEEALLAFKESERQGVVRGFDRLYQDLEEARGQCDAKLLPTARAEAGRQLQRAADLATRADEPFADAQLEAERRRLTKDWSGARSWLDQARVGGDPLVIGQASRDLADLTDAVDRLVLAGEPSLGAQAANAFSAASGAARDAIAEAERQQRRLDELFAEPLHGAVRRRRLESSRIAAASDLSAARQRLATSTTAAQVVAVETEAEAIAQRFSDLAAQAQTLHAEAQVAAPAPQPAAEAVTRPPEPEQRPESRVESRADAATVAEVRRRADDADLLLRYVAANAESPSELAGRQSSRLTILVAAARNWLDSPEASRLGDLPSRLRASSDALRLIAGTERYFAGEPRAALELLDAIEVVEGRLGAATLLVRAAGHFELFRLGGELDADLNESAVADARGCHDLDPEMVPAGQAFSPAFREFFIKAVAGS